MFGSNPIRPADHGDGSTLWIQDVFQTLQGEGPFTGKPALFIRLAGCNLSCFWCDTEFESSTWRPNLPDLMARVMATKSATCRLVVITGGEPFRQNIRPLCERLLDLGLEVQFETNGTLWIPLPESDRITIVCSPKTPTLNIELTKRISAYKYVIKHGETDTTDGLPTASTQRPNEPCHIARPEGDRPVFVLPLDELDAQKNKLNQQACIDIALKFGYQLTLQTHKILNMA